MSEFLLATFLAQLGNSGYPLSYFGGKSGIARMLSLCLLGGMTGQAGVVLLLSKQSDQVHVADVDILENPAVPYEAVVS